MLGGKVCVIYGLMLVVIGLARTQDIWDEEYKQIENIDQEDDWLLALCNNVNLIVYDKIEQRQFDCATKEWQVMERIIKKREASEQLIEEEGSGAPDETDVATGEEAPKEEGTVPEEPQIPEEPKENEPKINEEPKTDEEPKNDEEPKPDEELKTDEEPKTEEEPKTDEELKPEEEPKEAETDVGPKTEEATTVAIQTTNKDVDVENPSVGVRLIPIVEQPNLPSIPPVGQDEATDKFQDGNTLMENHPEIDGNSKLAPLQNAGPRSMQAQDKENVKTVEESSDSPKTGESAKVEKDSNILIIMFVGVVIVGIAAFGYNYIRKRNQNNDSIEVINDVEKAEKADKVEQEMHPLMNGNKHQPQEQEEVYKPTTSTLN